MIFISLSIAALFISSASSFSQRTVVLGTLSKSSFNESARELQPPSNFSFIKNVEDSGSFSDSLFDETVEHPEIYKNVTTTIVAKYGDSVQFECYASGTAPVKITWSKRIGYRDIHNYLLPNGKTDYEGNILQFPSVTQKSKGTYDCAARNTHYLGDYQSYTLEVEAEPLIIETIQTNEVGSNIQLICKAYCNPRSTFKWYKNGQLFTTGEKNEVDSWNHSPSSNPVDGILKISTKNNDYAGTYKCEIENEFGKDEKVFEVDGKNLSDTSD